MERTRVLILGAAGRDFHNFNVAFRGDERYRVVGFTATQIPDIEDRSYPAELAGAAYPDGIPIFAEDDLEGLVRDLDVDEVVFAYSDVSHEHVMHLASRALAAGADFVLLGPERTMLRSSKQVVAVTAVRTGAGKSPTTRRVCSVLRELDRKPVVVRHPMPYGDLAAQACQRFAELSDLDRHRCTIEEREEYEPLIKLGVVVYAGVDYERILREVESEADVILWDGGNNDLPFYVPDLHITVADPHRPGHELGYHPGEANLRRADVVIINKVDTASPDDVTVVRENVRRVNPRAAVVDAAVPISVEEPERICGSRVLVVEDGPTLTHGEMRYGAGAIAARKFGAAEVVDPREYAVGSIRDTFARYPHLSAVLPAMGYGDQQIRELEATINATPCDVVLVATPVDLRRVARLEVPALRVGYELQEIGRPNLEDVLRPRFAGS